MPVTMFLHLHSHMIYGLDVHSAPASVRRDQANELLRNDGAGSFIRITGGELDVATDDTRSVAFGDYDLDGRLDLVRRTFSYVLLVCPSITPPRRHSSLLPYVATFS